MGEFTTRVFDYWKLFHAVHKSLFGWYHPKIAILEKQLRKKLKNSKDLPLGNVFLRKFNKKDSDYSPVNYLEDDEKYFEKIKKWKNDFEKDYLERYPICI